MFKKRAKIIMKFKQYLTEENGFNILEKTYGKKTNLSIGLANIHAIVPGIEENKNKINQAIEIFKRKKVNIAIFPEFCLAGYFWDTTPEPDLDVEKQTGDDKCWEYMDQAVIENHWDWVKNSIESQLDDNLQFIIFNNIRLGPTNQKKYYNSTYIINKKLDYKNPKWIYDKTFLPGIEKTYTISGKTDRLVIETDWGRFGFSTCYDFCYSHLYQEMAQIDKVDGVIQIASWRGSSERKYPGMNISTDKYYGDLWDMLMDGTAARNQMWVISTNAVGIHAISKAKFWGGSGLWSPAGIKLLQGSHTSDELLIVHNVDIKGEVEFEKNDFNYSIDFNEIYDIKNSKRSFTRIKE